MGKLSTTIMGVFGLVIISYLCTQALTGTAWYITLLAWALPAVFGFVVLMGLLKGTMGGKD
jgi:hypothetical protein